MKYLGTISMSSIVLFWIVMNTLLVWRETETHRLDSYQRGVTAFLGNDLRRERWMGMYRKSETEHKKVGYTGLVMERVYNAEGLTYHANLETYFAGTLPLQSFFSNSQNSSSLKIKGQLTLDEDMKPIQMQLDLVVSLLEDTALEKSQSFAIEGVRHGSGFRVTLSREEEKLMTLPLPLEGLALSDGFAPSLPVADYKVGETYRVRVFNPLTPLGLGSDTATVRVVAETTESVHGILLDVFELETEWQGSKTRSLVTANGEVVRQELGPPLNLVLQHEKSQNAARKGFTR